MMIAVQLLVVSGGSPAQVPGDLFSLRLCAISDIDGDRQPDILVSDTADGDRSTNRGRVWALSGSSLAIIHTWQGEVGQCLGEALGSAGDLDGDAVPDVFLGTFGGGTPKPAQARFYSGRTGAFLYTLPVLAHGYPFKRSGPVFAAMADIDGDGVGDFVIGSTLGYGRGDANWVPRGGQVTAHSGRTGKELWRRTENEIDDWLGCSIAVTSDLNKDGIPDLAVAACPFGLGAGYVELLSAKDGSPIRRISAPPGHEGFAGTVVATSDLDSDRIDDLFVMAGERDKARSALALSGRDCSIIRSWTLDGGTTTYPSEVVGLPDVSGDGSGDLLITLPGTTSQGSTISVFSAREAEPLWTVVKGPFEASNFGCSVISIADRDGDAVADLLVGEATWRGSGPGAAHFYSGKTGKDLGELTRAMLLKADAGTKVK